MDPLAAAALGLAAHAGLESKKAVASNMLKSNLEAT